MILRHRAAGYRVGDLDRDFRRLRLEEGFLHAYGFMSAGTRDRLHPRHDPAGEAGRHAPAGLPAEVLAFVRACGPTHPTDLAARYGRERTINGWGCVPKATTRALEGLRHHGLLRVADRRDGIRVYEAAPRRSTPTRRSGRAACSC